MTSDANDIRIVQTADRIDLAPQLGEIYWNDWGDHIYPGAQTLEQWIATALAEAGDGSALPTSFLAIDNDDNVLGGVAVSARESDLQWVDEWTPWVTGMIVRPDQRSHGIGQRLLEAVHVWVMRAGFRSTWVLTGGEHADNRAVTFYQRCGWSIVEDTPPTKGNAVVLRRRHE